MAARSSLPWSWGQVYHLDPELLNPLLYKVTCKKLSKSIYIAPKIKN